VIDFFHNIDPKNIDVKLKVHDGYPEELAKGDTPEAMRGAAGDASREFPSELWIEQRDWATWAERNTQLGTWPINYIDRFTNQDPTHECTCHALRGAAEAARNRARGVSFPGPVRGVRHTESSKFGSVWLSPLSIYAEANPGQWGGAGCRQVMEIAVRRGFLPEKIQPRDDYGFRCAIQGTTGQGGINQSSGQGLPVSRFPEGWQDEAKNFKILEVIFPNTWEQMVCLVLQGYVVEVGRDGHAIPYALWDAAAKRMGYVDSYDVIRWDSLSTVQRSVGGAFAVATMSTPDDWMKPIAA
jgi:hypothetical protein